MRFLNICFCKFGFFSLELGGVVFQISFFFFYKLF